MTSIKLTFSYINKLEPQKELKGSIILRTTAIGIGSIALLIGILTLCNIPDLFTLGASTSGSLVACGSAAILVGTCFKCIEKTKPSSQASPLPSSYSLQAVIERIQKAKQDGLQTALFLGRTNDQSRPHENGWAWFSLDQNLEIGNSDHHLQIDFNNFESMRHLRQLFDKVVVDCSVLKFFEGSPWVILHDLLTKNPSSQLIVESNSGIIHTGNHLNIDGDTASLKIPSDPLSFYRREVEIFEAWKQRIGNANVQRELELYQGTWTEAQIKDHIRINGSMDWELNFMRFILKREGIEPSRKRYQRQFLQACRTSLMKLFHHVEWENGPYPYLPDADTEYWIAKHPK